MTAPMRTVVFLIRSAVAAVRSAQAELIMKMIFSKVMHCCESARRATVGTPKVRLVFAPNVLISGRRRAA
jgi:hypothetical protein